MVTAYKNSYDILGIALGGCYAQELSKHYGYVRISIPDKRLQCYYGDVKEGGILVDKRSCEESVIVHGSVSGPMLDMALPEKTRSVVFEGSKECLDPEGCSGFDTISLDLYLMYWRKRGARIGKRVGNKVEWEGGFSEEIVPESKRFSSW